MGKGRKPIAAEIKRATGAYSKNPQRENKSAPTADGNDPDMPDWFEGLEREKWSELVSDLRRNGVISSDTREILIAYCTAYRYWREARIKVATTGLAIEGFDKQGNVQITRNTYVTEMSKFRDQMNRLLPELGLTPASRQKLTAITADDEKENPFASIMARMGRG
jgi:P27 family predicted phage terminase small subunit